MRWNGHKHPRLHATCQLQTPLVRRLQPHERESKPLLAPETQSTQWVWPENKIQRLMQIVVMRTAKALRDARQCANGKSCQIWKAIQEGHDGKQVGLTYKTNLNQDTPQHKTIMKRKHANPKSTFIFAAHMQNMITRWWMPCAATLFHSLNGPNGPCAARLLPVCSPHSRNKFARQDPVICGWMPNERHMPERPAITRLDAADRQKTTYSSKNFCSHRGCCRCKVLRARLGILPNGCWKPFITSTRRRAAPDRPLWCITWQTWS